MADKGPGKSALRKRKSGAPEAIIDLEARDITQGPFTTPPGDDPGVSQDTGPVEVAPSTDTPDPVRSEEAPAPSETSVSEVAVAEPARTDDAPVAEQAFATAPPWVEQPAQIEAAEISDRPAFTPPPAGSTASSTASARDADPFLPPPQPRRAVFPVALAGLAGGLVGAVLAIGAVRSGVIDLGGADQGLSTRLAAIEQDLASTRDVIGQSVNRLSAVEVAAKAASESAAAAANLSSEAKSIGDAARQAADAAANRPAGSGGIDLGPIESRLTAAKEEFGRLEQRIASLEAAPGQAAPPDRSAATAVMMTTLAAAIESGRPFAAELQAAASILKNQDGFKSLEALAKKGVPTVSALRDSFQLLAPKLVAAAAGSPADAASSDDILSRLMDSAAAVVEIRKVGDDAAVAPPIVQAVVDALATGDLGAAVAAFDSLPDVVKAAGATWRADAGAAIDASELVAKLRGQAISVLGG